MTQTEIALSKISSKAFSWALAMTKEAFPNDDIRAVHNDIKVVDSKNEASIHSYMQMKHSHFMTRVCYGADHNKI